MSNKEFVSDRGLEEEKLVNENLIGRHIIERVDGFISPEELVSMVRNVRFEVDNLYWEVINNAVNK